VGRAGRPRMPADWPYPGHVIYHCHGARDAVAFLGLAEIGVTFPPPAMCRDFVAAAHCVLRQKREPLDRAPTGTHRRRGVVLSQHRHDAPPPGARTIFEMAVNRRIGLPKDGLLYLVHRLVFGVAIGDQKLRALLEIDDDRDRYPRSARPMRMRRRSGIAEKVARLWWLLHSVLLAL